MLVFRWMPIPDPWSCGFRQRPPAFGYAVVVEQELESGTFRVVQVPAQHGAHGQSEERAREQQRGGDRDPEEAQRGLQRASRSALPVTSREDALMASAAASGCRTPSAASGIATAL
jgi:hypothetical protein